jgi:hypothetical protein
MSGSMFASTTTWVIGAPCVDVERSASDGPAEVFADNRYQLAELPHRIPATRPPSGGEPRTGFLAGPDETDTAAVRSAARPSWRAVIVEPGRVQVDGQRHGDLISGVGGQMQPRSRADAAVAAQYRAEMRS